MSVKTQKIKIRVISKASDLGSLEDQWNFIVDESSNNPFLLFCFIKNTLKYTPKGWNPLILILSKGKTILGIAPLKMKINFGEYRIEFLQSDWCSDFIFSKKYRNICINYIYEFIFKELKCNQARFVFSHDSPNLSLFLHYCRIGGVRLVIYPEKGRRIIPLKSKWSEFEASLSRNLKKAIRRQKRNLAKFGSWKVIHVEGNQQFEVSKKILEVEKKSWKETWRTRRSKKDWSLEVILKTSKELSEKKKDFRLLTWFLEIRGKTISYMLGIFYKGIAILAKTSYDYQYRKFSPGIILHSIVLKDLFEENQYEYIDFLSDLKYQQSWNTQCLPRVGVSIAKGILPEIILIIRQKFLFAYYSSPFLNKKVKSFLWERRYDSRFNDFLDRFL